MDLFYDFKFLFQIFRSTKNFFVYFVCLLFNINESKSESYILIIILEKKIKIQGLTMSVIDSKVRELKNSITNLCNDRNYNVTREIFYELKGILSALDSLKIDNMFLAASNEWRNKFDENKLERDKLGFLNFFKISV